MRLFIAINFDTETVQQLLEVQEALRTRAVSGRFSRPENLHLTLAFLGETPKALVQEIAGMLAGLDSDGPFTLALVRLGRFVRGGTELWWAAPAEDDPGIARLLDLRRQLERALDAPRPPLRGAIPYDRKPFNAHITLGREMRLRGEAPLLPRGEAGIVAPLRRVSLMESARVRGQLCYTEIAGRDL